MVRNAGDPTERVLNPDNEWVSARTRHTEIMYTTHKHTFTLSTIHTDQTDMT